MRPFRTTLSIVELKSYIDRVLELNFPCHPNLTPIPIEAFDISLERLKVCFGAINRKYYIQDGISWFDHLHADHMCVFLWILSNTCWRLFSLETVSICLSHLNKRWHGIDMFYSLELPDIFYVVHPIGTVLGHAKYANYFVCYQGCTVGSDVSSGYPSFEGPAVLYSNSSVLGKCKIGQDVVLASNAHLLNTDVPSNTIVTGSFPNNINKLSFKSIMKRCFD